MDTGKKRRSFRLTDTQLAALDRMATRNQVTASEMLRAILNKWFGLEEGPAT